MKKSKTQNSKRYPESLGKISVKNFRVFDTETSFNFKPLTFLIGPNSSGKSSLMKLFAAISSSANKFKNNMFVPRLIGSNIGDDSTMSFSFNSSRPLPNEPLEIILNGNGLFQSQNIHFKLSYVDSETVLNRIRLSSFEMLQNNRVILKVSPVDAKSQDWIISFSFKGYYDIGFSFIHALIDELKSRKEFVFNDEVDPLLEALNSATVFKLKEMDDFELNTIKEVEQLVLSLEYIESNTRVNEDIEQTFLVGEQFYFEPYSYGINGFIAYMFLFLKKEIAKKFQNINLKYELVNTSLGDFLLEEFPKRISNELNNLLNSNLSFNRAPVFKSKREPVFDLLADDNTAFGVVVKSYIEQNKSEFMTGDLLSNNYIDRWLERFEIGKTLIIKSIENSFQYFKIEIIKEGGQIINISDLGYGVGQVLAYILLPYFANLDFAYTVQSMTLEELETNKEQSERKEIASERKIDFNYLSKYNGKIQKHLVYLEEPETNLHPNWQSVLTELFADQIMIGIRFVIETHSEYFVRKIQNMIAKKECDNKDVVIYYFNSEKEKRMNDQPTIREIHINENGTLNQSFGPGFFDEAGKLSLELLSINSIRKN